MFKSCLISLIGFLLYNSALGSSELYWYLASSLAKPGKEIVEKFNKKNQSCQVFLIIGGSGQLLSKLYLSKKGDLYTPASTAFLKQAVNLKIVKSQKPLLKQKPVFGISSSGISKIDSFWDLKKPGLKIALGNPKTMALGKSYLKIEQRMPGDLASGIRKNMSVLAINVTQIVNYILLDVVDTGTIFAAMAQANNIPFVEIPPQYNHLSQAYLIQLVFSDRADQLVEFEEFVVNQSEIFIKHGFKLN